MKDFLVLLAILPILLVFVIQFTCDYRGFEEVQAVENIVYEGREKARQEGGFSSRTIEDIRKEIAGHLGIPEEDIEIKASAGANQVGRYDKNRLIYYTVKVKLSDVMAGGKLMGIDAGENKRTLVIDSYIASEYVGDYL